jgi:hypothetical protein
LRGKYIALQSLQILYTFVLRAEIAAAYIPFLIKVLKKKKDIPFSAQMW